MSFFTDIARFRFKDKSEKKKPEPKIKKTVQATEKPDTYNEWITQLQFQTK